MLMIMWFLFILQFSIISVIPANASQNISLASTEQNNKTTTAELLGAVQKKK